MTLNKLKPYEAPWDGQPILACRKCQKKLKHDKELAELANLKKTVKKHNKRRAEELLHVINVPCMDLCPGNGVTVCVPWYEPAQLFIVRSEENLYELCNRKSK